MCAFIRASLMGDILKIGGTLRNGQRWTTELLVLTDGLGWVGLVVQCGEGLSLRQGFLRLWVAEKSGASSRSDFSAARIICNKTHCWRGTRGVRGGWLCEHVWMHQSAELRDWGLTHLPFSGTQFLQSLYECSEKPNGTKFYSSTKKGARKESLDTCKEETFS